MTGLKVVREPESEDDKRRWRLKMLRGQLLSAAVTYVKEGKDGTPQDRLRTASDLAGIPRNILEVELKK